MKYMENKIKVTATFWDQKLNLGWFGTYGSVKTVEYIGNKENLESIKSELNVMECLLSWDWVEIDATPYPSKLSV